MLDLAARSREKTERFANARKQYQLRWRIGSSSRWPQVLLAAPRVTRSI
jgi:hypothetical protein